MDSSNQRAYERARYRRRRAAAAAGTWLPPVAATLIRAHLRREQRRGVTLAAIADAAGVHRNILSRITNGKIRTVHGVTADAILSANPARPCRPGWVLAVGTSRRIQARAVMGFDLYRQALEYGVSEKTITEIAAGRRRCVTERVAKVVADGYRRALATPLHLLPPTDTPAIRRHRRKGWYGPGAWANIDDPQCRPEVGDVSAREAQRRKADREPAMIQSALAGVTTRDELTMTELVEVVDALAARGWSDPRIEAWLQWTGDARPGGACCVFRRRHNIRTRYTDAAA